MKTKKKTTTTKTKKKKKRLSLSPFAPFTLGHFQAFPWSELGTAAEEARDASERVLARLGKPLFESPDIPKTVFVTLLS